MTAGARTVPVCGIGASAGGIEALQQLFGALGTDLGLAYVVVLHLAPDHRSELPSILGRSTLMPISQVGDHEHTELEANHVYVIPPDRQLVITDNSIGAAPFDRPRGERNTIDLFFRSLAASHGDGFAIVLSGSGSDGAAGAKAVKEQGGLVLVQDPREAAHSSMPRATIDTGAADMVLPIRDLATALADLARGRLEIVPVLHAASDRAPMAADEALALTAVLELLKRRTGHDFSHYKRTTLLRRLGRRMQLTRQVTIRDYLEHLRAEPDEAAALLDDFLISVTTFFRDPEAWQALGERVLAPLVEGATTDEPLRAWVPGCATGEEAYTLAMLFLEQFERCGLPPNVLIFASDMDDNAISVARQGRYSRAISSDVSEARLDRFFHQDEDDHYRIDGALREHVVFTSHSVLRDPPFSRIHLISCRNLLIYLDRGLQEQLMRVFRYACRDDGHLFLGASEIPSDELFRTVDAKHRIFRARARPDDGRMDLPEILTSGGFMAFKGTRHASGLSDGSVGGDIHIAALEAVSPPSVVVDDRWNVLHVSPSASRFFQQAAGPPAQRLTDLVRPDLRADAHMALQRAFEAPGPQATPFVSVPFNGSRHRVALLAQQHRRASDGVVHVLVTFLDAGPAAPEPAPDDRAPADSVVDDLREQLRRAEQRLESMRDDRVLAYEDLRAANEELQSLNEEYRSTTEELETSREELQSINEELQTVNQELKEKLGEVSRAQADLENFIAASDVPMLFLDRELRVVRYTPQLATIVNIKARDAERPIADLTHVFDHAALDVEAQRVLDDPQHLSRAIETTSSDGRHFIIHVHAYQTPNHGAPSGVVVTFIDVTAIRAGESALRVSEQRLAAELDVMRELHRMTLETTAAPTMEDALDCVLSGAMGLLEADLGDIQLLNSASRALRTVSQRGFSTSWLGRTEADSDAEGADGSGSRRALRSRQTVQIPDVETDPPSAPFRGTAAAAGYRAVQCTPLIDRGDDLVGILSLYFRAPRAFSERDRQLGDLVGRQAAELIGARAQQDELSRLNQALRLRTEALEASQAQLAERAAQLTEQDRHREEFLSALGHELRNPMAAMQGAAALITVKARDEGSRRALAVLTRQIQHMTHLVNELLDVTRVKHGRLRLDRRPVEINRCALAAIENIRTQAEGKGLRLKYEATGAPTYVNADPERLAQIFDNLLRNAIIYTDRGTVRIATRAEAAHARVTVADTGVGFEPGRADLLFDPFTQQDATRGRGGLGLGLTLVKSLVEAHDGRITATSKGPGRGAEFSFVLPLTDAPAPAAEREVAPAEAHRVLVVDDQADVADMFGTLLETLGHEVRVAYDADDALKAARDLRPDVAFLDISMPKVGGAELGRRLRDALPADPLSIIAMTGFAADHPAVQDTVFDYHLLKPVMIEVVATLLGSLPPAGRRHA